MTGWLRAGDVPLQPRGPMGPWGSLLGGKTEGAGSVQSGEGTTDRGPRPCI